MFGVCHVTCWTKQKWFASLKQHADTAALSASYHYGKLRHARELRQRLCRFKAFTVWAKQVAKAPAPRGLLGSRKRRGCKQEDSMELVAAIRCAPFTDPQAAAIGCEDFVAP